MECKHAYGKVSEALRIVSIVQHVITREPLFITDGVKVYTLKCHLCKAEIEVENVSEHKLYGHHDIRLERHLK